jgi:hypothetical protein
MYFEYYYVAAQPQEDPTYASASEFSISNFQKWFIRDLVYALTKPKTDFDISKSGIYINYFTGYSPQWDIVTYNEGDLSATIVSKSSDNQFKKYITISTDALANSFVTQNASGSIIYQTQDITLKLKLKDNWGKESSEFTFKYFPTGGALFVSTNNTHLAMTGYNDSGTCAVPCIISDFEIYDTPQGSSYAKFIGLGSTGIANIWGTTNNDIAVYPGNIYPTNGTYTNSSTFKCTIGSAIKAITPYSLDSSNKVVKSNYANHIYINKMTDPSDYHLGGNISSMCGIYAMPLATSTVAKTGIAYEEIVIKSNTYVVWPLVNPVTTNAKRLLVRKN